MLRISIIILFTFIFMSLVPLDAHAAFGSVGTIGTVQSATANQASLQLTTTANAEAGNLVIIQVAVDNNQTTDGDEGAVSSVVDSTGNNTWTKIREFTNGQGAAQGGATISMWYSIISTQINSGGTITANFTNSTSRDASAMVTWEYTIAAGSIIQVAGNDTDLATDGSTTGPGSQTISGLTSGEYLFVRGVAQENNSTANGFSGANVTANYTAFGIDSTSGGGAAANMGATGEFRITTATGSTSSGGSWSTNARDYASIYVALVEIGVLDHYSVSAATPQTAGVCSTGTNSITAQDVANHTLTNDTSTVTMSTSGTGVTFYTASNCLTSTTQYTLSSGTVNFYYITNRAQSMTITATKNASTETGTSSSITVNPNSHTRLVITLPGQTFTAGVGNSGTVTSQRATIPFVITTITATDDYFNTITSYSGSKTLSYSGPAGSPTYTTSVNFTSGQSTTTLTTVLSNAESTTITVADGGSYGYASSTLTVSAAPEGIKIRSGSHIRGGQDL